MSFVTCRLTGRLGNNIFQVMTAMAHAWRNGVDYKVPSFVRSKFTNKHPLDFLPNLSKHDEARIKFDHYCDGWKYEPIPYKPFMRISGWYQNYQYFNEFRGKIIEEFRVPKEKIQAVAVHFRAGDYKLYPTKHPIMPKDYYEQALSMFDGLPVHVFSDEPETAKEVITGADVYHQVGEPFEDWQLMCCYQYFVISNSTYSWTAAYLSGSNNVVTPHHGNWYGKDNKHIYTGELILPEWEQIKL